MLDRLRHVALFGLVLVLASGLAALLGALIYSLSVPTTTSFWDFWTIWWLGDGMGVLLVTPLVLGWLQGPTQPTARHPLEATALLALTLLLTIWVFSQGATDSFPRRPFLLFPLLLWAAVRFGVRGAASIALLIAAIAITATLNDVGPLLGTTSAGTVMLLQEYLAVLAFTSLALAALLQELRATHDELDSLNRQLEARVEERTRELQQANQRLEELASIDPLTGASNRRHFLEQAKAEISRVKRQGSAVVGDHAGHRFLQVDQRPLWARSRRQGAGGVGCHHPCHAARRRHLRPNGRRGVYCHAARSGASEALQMAERLRLLIAQNEVPDCPARITVSAGLAGLENESDEIVDLLRRADQGLYRAKNQGRNQVCLGQGPSPDA